jgi:hypothetical protein
VKDTSAEIQTRLLEQYDFDPTHWTPKKKAAKNDHGDTSKTAWRFVKELKKIVDKALKSAKEHVKRSDAAAGSAVPHVETGPPSAARFTSMRFP